MNEEHLAQPVIELLKKFNEGSESLFIDLAGALPALLNELDDDVSPWITKREPLFSEFTRSLYSMRDFLSISGQEDLYLFQKTHNNFDLTLLSDTKDESLRKKEKALNVLLRKAERDFVALFTLAEIFSELETAQFESKTDQALYIMRQTDAKMTDLAQSVSVLKRPILLVMEEIQKQDIMRQSINHAIMALEELTQTNFEEPLEDLTFRIDLYRLADAVIHEVKAMLIQVESNFKSQISLIQEQVTMMTAQKDLLQEETEGANHEQQPAFLLNEALLDMDSFDALYVRYLSLKTKIIKAHRSVLRKAQKFIEETHDASSLSDEMVVIRKIVDLETQTVHDTADDTISRHDQYLDVKKLLVNTLGNLVNLNDEMINIIKETTVYTETFISYLNRVTEDIDKTGLFVQMLTDSSIKIEEFINQLSEQKDKVLAEQGLSHWDLKSNRIIDLTSHFTILSHKKAAAEIVGFGFDEEEGMDEGEIILF